MATADNERYFRYIFLLGKGGPLVLKGIFNREVQKEGKTLSRILLDNNGRLRQLIRNDSQYERVFPSASPVNCDLDTWDIYLLCLVTLNIFGSKLSSQECNDIKSIRTFRNEIQGHFASPSLEEIEYHGLRNDLIQVLLRLSSVLSRQIHDSCQDFIKTSASGPLEKSSILEDLKEFKEELSTQMKSDHGATHVKLDDLCNDVKEIKKLQELLVQSERKHIAESQPSKTTSGIDEIKIHEYEYGMEIDAPMRMAIAVIGQSDTGKSSLINTLRGVDHNHESAASVGDTAGSVEDTEEYAHPQNENIVFFDLPSLGTLRYSRESYLSMVDFTFFDIFLLCVGVRLTEIDVTIAKEIHSRGKRYYIIRSKVDMTANVDDLHLRREQNTRFRKIRKKIETHRDKLPGKPPIFLISSQEPTMYDFPRMIKQIQNDAYVVTAVAIAEKVFISKSHIQKIYHHNMEDIPLFPTFQDSYIHSKADVYKNEFHLSDYEIAVYACACGIPKSSFRTKAKLKTQRKSLGLEPFTAYVISVVKTEKNMWKYSPYIPIIGFFVSAKLGRTILQKVLDDCRDDAMRVYDFLTTFSSGK